MRDVFDHDPVTGVTEYFDYDVLTGKTYIRTEQDVKPILDRTMALRNEGIKDGGIKAGFWHYCDIPPVVELELLKKGINIHKAEDRSRMFDEINTNYPYLKVTDKHHSEGGRNGRMVITPRGK